MKDVGAIVLSYGLTSYLEDCLSALSWMDDILVVNPQKPFNGGEEIKDETEKIVNSFKNEKIKILSGDFKTEHDARNAGIKALQHKRAVFVLDADEIMFEGDCRSCVNALIEKNVSAVLIRPIDYWKTAETYAYPIRVHAPIVCVNPKRVEFYDGRCARMFDGNIVLGGIYLHHFGYALTNKEMEWKVRNYHKKGNVEAKTHNVVKNWLKDKWYRSDRFKNVKDLGMVNAEEVKCIKPVERQVFPKEFINKTIKIREVKK